MMLYFFEVHSYVIHKLVHWNPKHKVNFVSNLKKLPLISFKKKRKKLPHPYLCLAKVARERHGLILIDLIDLTPKNTKIKLITMQCVG